MVRRIRTFMIGGCMLGLLLLTSGVVQARSGTTGHVPYSIASSPGGAEILVTSLDGLGDCGRTCLMTAGPDQDYRFIGYSGQQTRFEATVPEYADCTFERWEFPTGGAPITSPENPIVVTHTDPDHHFYLKAVYDCWG